MKAYSSIFLPLILTSCATLEPLEAKRDVAFRLEYEVSRSVLEEWGMSFEHADLTEIDGVPRSFQLITHECPAVPGSDKEETFKGVVSFNVESNGGISLLVVNYKRPLLPETATSTAAATVPSWEDTWRDDSQVARVYLNEIRKRLGYKQCEDLDHLKCRRQQAP